MAELYIKGEEQGHITNHSNYGECDSDCEECLASPACIQLAGGRGRNYNAFQANYPVVEIEIERILNEEKINNTEFR